MLLILVGLLSIAICYIIFRPFTYWTERGVKQGKTYPIFGSNWKLLFRKENIAEVVEANYRAVPNVRYSGMYQFSTPILVLKDPDLIKQITVKDFDHFQDHCSFVPESKDPIWNKNLFALTGKKWREMRSTMSPAFTSSKMKNMFTLISQNGERFIKHFVDKNQEKIEIELKDTLSRFTNDVIANTAFGVEIDSLGEKDNEFYIMGRKTANLNGFWNLFKLLGYLAFPKLFKHFDIKFFSQEAGDFFTKVIKTNIESREKHNIVRPDLIHLLLEARKHGLKHETTPAEVDTGFATVEESDLNKTDLQQKFEITDADIVAQGLVFFFGGFESVSSLLSFTIYELATNPEVQQKLIKEVDKTREACKGNLTYEALLKMKYLDMVISETLRKWPSSPAVDRVCVKPYTIEPKTSDESPVYLNVKDVVWIPIYGLHRDPENFPEPDKFIPERFSDENKNNIKPYTYIPFGAGPRNCIGSRFALLETKTLIYYLLSSFEITPCEKSSIPLVLSKTGILLSSEGGFWFALKRRNNA